MTILNTFLHPKGSKQAPEHSEYEVNMAGIGSIVEVKNATIFDEKYLQVIDEKKPVFIIAATTSEDEAIWRFEGHIDRKSPCSMSVKTMLTNDIGAILSMKMTRMELNFVKIRRGKKIYFAGNTLHAQNADNIISYKDLLEFVSGDISWNDLKGRSYLFKKKILKALSIRETVAELKEKLEQAHKNKKTIEYVLQVDKAYSNVREHCIIQLTNKLDRIPAWIRKLFSAN